MNITDLLRKLFLVFRKDISFNKYRYSFSLNARVFLFNFFCRRTCIDYFKFSRFRPNATTLIHRQLSDGKHLIQMTFVKHTMKDCIFSKNRKESKEFIHNFKSDLRILTTSNITITSLDDKPLPKKIHRWFNFHKMRKQCRRKYGTTKTRVKKTSRNVTDPRVERYYGFYYLNHIFLLIKINIFII